MGKQYTTAPILVNSNGDPIPQYLDITDKTDSPQGTFKPLTNETIQKVQLTGSFVEIGRVVGRTVTAGSRVNVFTFPTKTELDFKEIVIVIRRQGVEHTYKVDIDWYIPSYTINSVIYGESGIINTNYPWAYAKIPVKTTGFRVFITNDGQADCSYDVYIFGVR